MAQRNEKVFDRVRQELTNNPNLGSKELYDLAQSVDKSIKQDSLQQFHARYVLPVKRERSGQQAAKSEGKTTQRRGRRKTTATAPAPSKSAAATPPEVAKPAEEDSAPAKTRTRRSRQSATAPSSASDRDQVRALLLQFAQELTDADSRSSLVKVLGRVDSYVDRIAPAQS